MASIDKYQVRVFGSPTGVDDSRAQILVFSGKKTVGHMFFHDPGMPFPADTNGPDGLIKMHLPSAMFEGVIDLLRNEKPIDLNFYLNRALFDTTAEPVGEGE